MTLLTSRRSLILGATAILVTAPAIVRAASLMKVKAINVKALTFEEIQNHLVDYFHEAILDAINNSPTPLYYNDKGIGLLNDASMEAYEKIQLPYYTITIPQGT